MRSTYAAAGALALVTPAAAQGAWADAPVTHSLFEHTNEVAPTFRPDAPPLPDTLVVPPGTYRVGSRSYGLWRNGFYDLGERRAVVADRWTWPSAIVSGLAWAMGTDAGIDEQLWGDAGVQATILRRPSLYCGYQVEVVRKELTRLGHPARAAALVSREHGGGGHTLLEVWDAGRWTLYDVLYNFQPLVDGHPTTIVEWVRTHGTRGGTALATDGGPDPQLIANTPGYLSYLGTPLVGDLDSGSWPYSFTDPADRDYLTALQPGYRYLPPDQFARLYGATFKGSA